MKTNIALLLLIATLTYFATLHFTNNSTPKINKVPSKDNIAKTMENPEAIPTFTFTDINGNTHNPTDFKDKIIILNFWASWCAPCIKEFPNLLNAADQYKNDVTLIALSSDLNEEAVRTFITKMKKSQDLDFKGENIFIALDRDQKITSGKFQTFKLPETLIIDQNQKIRHKLIGADWALDDLNQIIEKLK